MSRQVPRAPGGLLAAACVLAATVSLLAGRPATANPTASATSSSTSNPSSTPSPTSTSTPTSTSAAGAGERGSGRDGLPPGAAWPDAGPSTAVFPPQKMPLRFDHRRHVKDVGATCLTCHGAARRSRAAADRLLPAPSICDACHGTDHGAAGGVRAGPGASGECGFCHVGWRPGDGDRVARVDVPPPNLRMDHAVHLARNIGCAQCHGAVGEVGLATRDQLPRMAGCFRCHDMPPPSRGQAKADCLGCHLDDGAGRMRTTFATGTMRPPQWLHNAQHGPDFIERHKRVAADDSAFCGRCHAEDFCTDCHDGRIRPRAVHPGDWISMHPIAARQDNPRCGSCHRAQSFCLGCHQRAGVVMSGPNATGRAFHPAGWADLRRRGPGHHSWEAQRNLAACTSCHTERDCAMCHATTARQGLGVRPHPPGFTSRCGAMLRRNDRPCLVCHDDVDRLAALCD